MYIPYVYSSDMGARELEGKGVGGTSRRED